MDTKKYFVVELGSYKFYFEELEKANEFFKTITESEAINMGDIDYSHNYSYKDKAHSLEMKAITVNVYNSRKEASIAKENDKEE